MAEPHVLVVSYPGDEEDPVYTVECPGVSDDCRGWLECQGYGCPPFEPGSAGEDEAEANGEYWAHGVAHRWDSDGPGWLATDGCWLVTADELHDAAAEVLDAPIPGRGTPPAAARHPVRFTVDWRGEQLTLHLVQEEVVTGG